MAGKMIKLSHTDGSFSDPTSRFFISGSQSLPLPEKVSKMMQKAIANGALIVFEGAPTKAQQEKTKTDEEPVVKAKVAYTKDKLKKLTSKELKAIAAESYEEESLVGYTKPQLIDLILGEE